MKNENKPIHPTGHSQSGTGLTKREYFSGLAMQAILTGSGLSLPKNVAAKLSVENADALLKELEK